MRILIPILGFGKSGGYRVLSQFANYWIKAGHEVYFLVRCGKHKAYFPTEAKILVYSNKGLILKDFDYNEEINIDKYTKKTIFRKMFSKYSFLFYKLPAIRLLKALNNINEHFDIILANDIITASPIAKSLIKTKAKFYYIQAYEPEYYSYKMPFIGHLIGNLLSKSYELKSLNRIVNSPIYYQYKNLTSDRFVFCGLDLKIYHRKAISEVNLVKHKIKIGAIGRPEVYKGTSYVVDAVRYLNNTENSHYEFELYLAFNNEQSEKNIYSIFPRNDEELADFYRDMDIIIAPGTIQYGAVHYPVLESMACGTPIITTFYLPATESNAWLVRPHSFSDIICRIFEIINNPTEAQKRVENALRDVGQFEWSVVADKMLMYFKESLEQ